MKWGGRKKKLSGSFSENNWFSSFSHRRTFKKSHLYKNNPALLHSWGFKDHCWKEAEFSKVCSLVISRKRFYSHDQNLLGNFSHCRTKPKSPNSRERRTRYAQCADYASKQLKKTTKESQLCLFQSFHLLSSSDNNTKIIIIIIPYAFVIFKQKSQTFTFSQTNLAAANIRMNE